MESSRTWPWPRGASRPADGVVGLGLGKKFQLPPCKRLKSSLFFSYGRRRTGTGGQNVASQVLLPTVVKNYLGFVRQQSDGLSADAWRAVQLESQFTILHKLFEKVFCTPATSAPAERMFSHSGLFMRPHRAIIIIIIIINDN